MDNFFQNIERLPPLTLNALDPERIAEAAVAFANSDGGVLLFPALLPSELSRLQAALSMAGELIRPAFSFAPPQTASFAQGPGWTVYVPRGKRVYALADGRVLVRTLRDVRELDGEAIRRLAHAREQGDFEAEVVPKATPADLDEALLAEFARHAMPKWAGNAWTLWKRLGALTPEGNVTVAGILLFGREPQRWLPEAHVHFQHVAAGVVIREEVLGGPLRRQMEKLWQVLSLHARLSGPRPPYAPLLLREIIFNALVHRDYRLRRRAVQVRLSRDELVIESPGGLCGYLTRAADMTDGRYLRNPRLYAVLTRWGVCEERSTHSVTASAEAAGYPTVHWNVTPDAVRVRIERSVPTVKAEAARMAGLALSERQRRILRLARQRGSVTLRELQARWGEGVRPASLQRDLDALVAAGYLRRFGGRAAVYYVR